MLHIITLYAVIHILIMRYADGFFDPYPSTTASQSHRGSYNAECFYSLNGLRGNYGRRIRLEPDHRYESNSKDKINLSQRCLSRLPSRSINNRLSSCHLLEMCPEIARICRSRSGCQISFLSKHLQQFQSAKGNWNQSPHA